MRKLLKKYWDLIPYAVFGVLTTIINILSYWVCAHLFHIQVLFSTVLAWFVSVLFAYLTNRKWVFHSEASGSIKICREIASFFGCRIGTELVDLAAMFIFVNIMHLDDVIVKTAANIVVIILNYIFSKFIIFKHKVNQN